MSNGLFSAVAGSMTRRRLLQATAGLIVSAGLVSPIQRAAASAQERASALELLRKSLKGRLLLPAAADYFAWSVSTNTRFDSVLPLATVLCESAEDVATAVTWARQEGVPLAIRGGGHNYVGMSSTNGLLIVTRLMRQIEVDTATGIARIQSGAVNGELLRKLRDGNWMLPIGTCPQVGVTGLTLGGGVGDNTRWAGLTSDHLTATTAVLAGGDLVAIDATQNSDLFWACRGGAGGNFAIHTDLTFQLVPAPAKVSFFGFEFVGAEDTREVYAIFDELLHSSPIEFSAFAFIRSRPRGGDPDEDPWLLDPARFPTVEIIGCFLGTEDDLKDLVRPLIDMEPVNRFFDSADFWRAQDWLAVLPGLRHGWEDTNRFMNRRLNGDEIDEMIEILLQAPFGWSDRYVEFGLFGWAGGKVSTIAADATAYVHRASTTLFRAGISWGANVPLIDQLALQDWLDVAYDFIARVGQPASFQNWPNERVTDWPTAYYGDNLPRLVQIKRTYDPDNLFRGVQSIPTTLS